MLGKRVLIKFDSLVSTFNIGGFKRRTANKQGVKNYSNTPNVNFVRMARSTAQNFRSDVIWSATNGSFTFTIKHNFSR